MGRISIFPISFIVLLILSGLIHYLSANESKAVFYERDATRLENLADQETDLSLKKELKILAERRRESARWEREKHYNKPQNIIQDTKIPREIDKTFPLPPSKRYNTGNVKSYKDSQSGNSQDINSQNKNRFIRLISEGIWEVGIGWGTGIANFSPGGMYLQNPYLVGALQTDFVPRAGIAYDNVFTLDSRESPRAYAVRPGFFKLNYWDNSGKFGFGVQERSFRQNISYNAWNEERPTSSGNAVHYGTYSWLESKFNVFFREDWSYDKTLTVLWGLRVQSGNLSEKASFPILPGTYEYNENHYSLSPNLGMNYTQNFFGVFLFTAGAEVSVGSGGLSYNNRFFRGGNQTRGDYLRFVETEDPIPMQVFGGEFYTKYDFLLNENHRIGISWNYQQFFRQTDERHFPRILVSDLNFLEGEYRRVLARSLIYNDESSDVSRQRYHIFRFLQLEYTYVF